MSIVVSAIGLFPSLLRFAVLAARMGHDQIVAMHHGGAPGIAEDLFDFAGFAPGNQARIGIVVTGKAATDLAEG